MTVVAFLNEVAGGRRLVEAIRTRVDAGAGPVVLVSPQNQPAVGQIVDVTEVQEAAQSRVEVTQQILDGFGIPADAVVLDPDPLLALDDAVRAYEPSELLISCLEESRYGLLRRDLISFAKRRFPDLPIEHIAVRVSDDAVRWDVTHTLVVATQTVSSPDLIARLLERAEENPHRYTFVCPRSGDITREEVCDRLAATLTEMYRNEVDATGQPMSPEPFPAIQNAIEHYRLDEILISTFAGRSSRWLEEGLIDQVHEVSDIPVEHFEASGAAADPAAVGGGVS